MPGLQGLQSIFNLVELCTDIHFRAAFRRHAVPLPADPQHVFEHRGKIIAATQPLDALDEYLHFRIQVNHGGSFSGVTLKDTRSKWKFQSNALPRRFLTNLPRICGSSSRTCSMGSPCFIAGRQSPRMKSASSSIWPLSRADCNPISVDPSPP